ncbi:DUF362 domain-containing protein [Candidatus Hydrogenedentota bacterium]
MEADSKHSRRQFIRATGAAGLVLGGLAAPGCGKKDDGETAAAKVSRKSALSGDLAIASGEDPAAMTRAAVDALGGMGKLVRSGDIVVVKPNIGWEKKPEFCATTNPMVVAAVVEMCFEAGAKKVRVFDRPCNDPNRTYVKSGIQEAAEKAGAETPIFRPDDPLYRPLNIGGRILQTWPAHGYATEADVFINVPVAKHHDLARVTLGMKNLMGIVGGERGDWHKEFLHERIAEFTAAFTPDLTILDAYRRLAAHGPTGGRLQDVDNSRKGARRIITSVDPVAVDAYGTTLFDGLAPADIKYIQYAAELGVGEADLGVVTKKEITI